MRYIPKKVVFTDVERVHLKNYMRQWDKDGKIRVGIDNTTEFDCTNVRENDKYVPGFAIECKNKYDNDSVTYVSFASLDQYILDKGWVNGKKYKMS